MAAAPRSLLLLALQQPLEAPLPDGNEVARSLLGRQRASEDALDTYSYDVEQAEERLDSKGRLTRRESQGFQVFYVKGLPVRRQVAENGRPLDAKAQAKEDRRVRERVRLLEGGRVAREQVGVRLSQILERFEFRSLARESHSGRDVLVLAFEPRPGKRDLDSDHVLRALAGSLWVDEQDRAVRRAEIESTRGFKVALGWGASLKSLAVSMEFRRLEDGVWLPESVVATASGRVLIFKGFRRRRITSYSNYRRFEASSEERFDIPVPD
jgi:hypothetical protein